MRTKDLSKMTILDQDVLQKAEKGRFVVDKDYNLNKSRLVVPKGMTIDLAKGSINNGTLVLDDALLENMSDGCIDAQVEGTIRNNIIYTSHFSSANNLRLVDYSDMEINYNQDETITSVINISGANTNGNTNTVFNGNNHNFTCYSTFFSIKNGSKNITIENFKAIAVGQDNTFEEMVTSDGAMSGIHVLNNIVIGFKIGISLNNDSGGANNTVSYCTVIGNTVKNCFGSESGQGYGIHLANARYCTVSQNQIENCQRHSIYHAYGEHNTISYNTIKNHCQELSPIRLLAALEIGRKSNDVTVSHNTFESNNNVCLLVYSPDPGADDDGDIHGEDYPWRYGKCENIYILNNTFKRGNLTGNIGNYPFIYIGYEGATYAELEDDYLVEDVHILNNSFEKSGGDNQKCIRINQCKNLQVQNNDFKLGLPYSSQTNTYLVIEIPTNFISGYVSSIVIILNTFNYLSSGICPLYLMGENLSLINSSYSPNYHIVWYNNTLLNQIIGGNTMYQMYNPNYPPGNNCVIL